MEEGTFFEVYHSKVFEAVGGWQMEDGHLFVCSEAGCTVGEG
jgi:hypothetical protein